MTLLSLGFVYQSDPLLVMLAIYFVVFRSLLPLLGPLLVQLYGIDIYKH